MYDILEEEARALLAGAMICQESPAWAPIKPVRGTVEIICGLVDEVGIGHGLYVHLVFRRSPSTSLPRYKFSVFRTTSSGPERVYQLDVEQMKSKPKNAHSMAHEHFGNTRMVGDVSWLNWSFEEVLARFCVSTKISFTPNLNHPELFELK